MSQDSLWLATEMKKTILQLLEKKIRIRVVTSDNASVISAAVKILNGKADETVYRPGKNPDFTELGKYVRAKSTILAADLSWKVCHIKCAAHTICLALAKYIEVYKVNELLDKVHNDNIDFRSYPKTRWGYLFLTI